MLLSNCSLKEVHGVPWKSGCSPCTGNRSARQMLPLCLEEHKKNQTCTCVHTWTVMRLTALCSCVTPTAAGVNTPKYTIFCAYFLLFIKWLQIIEHQPGAHLPTASLIIQQWIHLQIPPFTGGETEAELRQSWGQRTLWPGMFQGQVKLRALRTGSGTLALALGQREGGGHLLVSFPEA